MKIMLPRMGGKKKKKKIFILFLSLNLCEGKNVLAECVLEVGGVVGGLVLYIPGYAVV